MTGTQCAVHRLLGYGSEPVYRKSSYFAAILTPFEARRPGGDNFLPGDTSSPRLPPPVGSRPRPRRSGTGVSGVSLGGTSVMMINGNTCHGNHFCFKILIQSREWQSYCCVGFASWRRDREVFGLRTQFFDHFCIYLKIYCFQSWDNNHTQRCSMICHGRSIKDRYWMLEDKISNMCTRPCDNDVHSLVHSFVVCPPTRLLFVGTLYSELPHCIGSWLELIPFLE